MSYHKCNVSLMTTIMASRPTSTDDFHRHITPNLSQQTPSSRGPKNQLFSHAHPLYRLSTHANLTNLDALTKPDQTSPASFPSKSPAE
jgi:hypothetical protein